ncbi:MAG TPA: hypothetical protein VEU33_27025 [Archangium sp.]|nr:hypothetical protein [Archangium sp.]
MQTALLLPGLDRLMDVCRKHGLPLETSSPEPSAPTAGQLFLGFPFDPMLAASHARLGGAVLGDFHLYTPGPHEDGLARINEGLRRNDAEPFRSSLVFGQEPSLAYYYGTVPLLADPQGLQPVVYIDAHDQMFVLPVASSVDRFFDLFSRYLEAVVEDPQYVEEHHSSIAFPWDVPELIARDEPLVRMVEALRFDFLLKSDEHTRSWFARVRQCARR